MIEEITSSSCPLRIGTRPSPLALKQVEAVVKLLPLDIEYEIVKISCSGDKQPEIIQDLDFYKQIERELVSQSIDIGVHSAKDLSCSLPEELCIGAYLKRDNPIDVLMYRNSNSLQPNCVIGTTSERRKAFIKSMYPNCILKDIRGNIQTRLDKLNSGKYDAIILSLAALTRLGLEETTIFDPLSHLGWSPGQGAIAIECRKTDAETLNILSRINHRPTSLQVTAEKAVLKAIGGGCNAPLAVTSSIDEGNQLFSLEASYYSSELKTFIRHKAYSFNLTQTSSIGKTLGERILFSLQQKFTLSQG